ncbi:hypothetical protein AVEN_72860-1 [Araneus ventricosus]|uniref:Uncharacterized protein n=1 Tax=Araneus ventricosus TaxID=182803 RepID=A0A4Y2RQ45_ARAVE|nr:hypothetical protein AVEN_72860-1 [Araneus ventricosus]
MTEIKKNIYPFFTKSETGTMLETGHVSHMIDGVVDLTEMIFNELSRMRLQISTTEADTSDTDPSKIQKTVASLTEGIGSVEKVLKFWKNGENKLYEKKLFQL